MKFLFVYEYEHEGKSLQEIEASDRDAAMHEVFQILRKQNMESIINMVCIRFLSLCRK